jgi:hypothetical protein
MIRLRGQTDCESTGGHSILDVVTPRPSRKAIFRALRM